MADLCGVSKQTAGAMAILPLGRIKKMNFDFEIKFYFVPKIASHNLANHQHPVRQFLGSVPASIHDFVSS